MTDNFSDNDIMWLGSPASPDPKKPWWKTKAFVITMACLFVAGFTLGITAALLPDEEETLDDEPGMFEQEIEQPNNYEATELRAAEIIRQLTAADSANKRGCLILDHTEGIIGMRIYYPCNATARLQIGLQPLSDTTSILTLQAADIRADNQQIVGAFVENGNIHSKGLSKRGYCAIIDGNITVGVADNSPLFDEAVATGGYFFRQYPLVENGIASSTQLKNESIRRGLCDLAGHIIVVESTEPVTFYDFGQALAEMGVWNAIYLIGGGALGNATDLNGKHSEWGIALKKVPENINYIFWK